MYVDGEGDDGEEARVEDDEKAKEWIEVMEGLWVCRFCGAQSSSAAIVEGLCGEEKQTSRMVHVGKCAHLTDSRKDIEYRKEFVPTTSRERYGGCHTDRHVLRPRFQRNIEET